MRARRQRMRGIKGITRRQRMRGIKGLINENKEIDNERNKEFA